MNKKVKNQEQENMAEELLNMDLSESAETTENNAANEADEKLALAEERYLRLAAEYENYKRRTRQEKEALYADAVACTVKEILPILDSLERAVVTGAESDNTNAVTEGIELITKMTASALEKLGVDKIEAVGAQFDANLHEAVMHIEDDAYGENEVVEEFSKGYRYGDKIIRHSIVKVAN